MHHQSPVDNRDSGRFASPKSSESSLKSKFRITKVQWIVVYNSTITKVQWITSANRVRVPDAVRIGVNFP
jgi:hypothetical protein